MSTDVIIHNCFSNRSLRSLLNYTSIKSLLKNKLKTLLQALIKLMLTFVFVFDQHMERRRKERKAGVPTSRGRKGTRGGTHKVSRLKRTKNEAKG